MSKKIFVVIIGILPVNTITSISKKNLPVITITEKMKTRLPVLPERKDFSTVNKPCLEQLLLLPLFLFQFLSSHKIDIHGDSNKVLQRVFSFIVGDNCFLLFTNKTTSFEVFNRDNFFP